MCARLEWLRTDTESNTCSLESMRKRVISPFSVGNAVSQLVNPNPLTSPSSAILSEKSRVLAIDKLSALVVVLLRLCNSIQSALPVVSKCISLMVRKLSEEPVLAFGRSRVGALNRNQAALPAGLRPRDLPSSGMAVVSALVTVLPLGSVRYRVVVILGVNPDSE